MNLNKVFLIGNLTRDPELKALPSGTAVASFGVATNRVWKDQKGEKREDVQFHNVVAFGRQAEVINQYLKKGSMIFVEGRLQTQSWDGQDGVKRYKTEIVAERIQLGPRPFSGQAAGGQGFRAPQKSQGVDAAPHEEIPTIEIESGNPSADGVGADARPDDLPF
ncbi:MAG: single-stranded DNA-binding protein [Candidatus Liptonbacteria bacterium]|nr:single-stranded DNA-binding protein [Candidatus Liptonbacteria bacterium]